MKASSIEWIRGSLLNLGCNHPEWGIRISERKVLEDYYELTVTTEDSREEEFISYNIIQPILGICQAFGIYMIVQPDESGKGLAIILN